MNIFSHHLHFCFILNVYIFSFKHIERVLKQAYEMSLLSLAFLAEEFFSDFVIGVVCDWCNFPRFSVARQPTEEVIGTNFIKYCSPLDFTLGHYVMYYFT